MGKQDLDQLCSDSCRRSLLQMRKEIQSNCMADIVVKDDIAYPGLYPEIMSHLQKRILVSNISVASFMIDQYLYAYDISCMKDA